MVCYKCNQKIVGKDIAVFVAGHPVHYDGCPKKKRKK